MLGDQSARGREQGLLALVDDAEPDQRRLLGERTARVRVPVQQEENKTETLSIGGADGNSIPWLIEIPQN